MALFKLTLETLSDKLHRPAQVDKAKVMLDGERSIVGRSEETDLVAGLAKAYTKGHVGLNITTAAS